MFSVGFMGEGVESAETDSAVSAESLDAAAEVSALSCDIVDEVDDVESDAVVDATSFGRGGPYSSGCAGVAVVESFSAVADAGGMYPASVFSFESALVFEESVRVSPLELR